MVSVLLQSGALEGAWGPGGPVLPLTLGRYCELPRCPRQGCPVENPGYWYVVLVVLVLGGASLISQQGIHWRKKEGEGGGGVEEGLGGVCGEDGRPATARLGTGILTGKTRPGAGCDPTAGPVRTVRHCPPGVLFDFHFRFLFILLGAHLGGHPRIFLVLTMRLPSPAYAHCSAARNRRKSNRKNLITDRKGSHVPRPPAYPTHLTGHTGRLVANIHVCMAVRHTKYLMIPYVHSTTLA